MYSVIVIRYVRYIFGHWPYMEDSRYMARTDRTRWKIRRKALK